MDYPNILNLTDDIMISDKSYNDDSNMSDTIALTADKPATEGQVDIKDGWKRVEHKRNRIKNKTDSVYHENKTSTRKEIKPSGNNMEKNRKSFWNITGVILL